MFSIKKFVKSYEIKKSKTNHDIPVVNGVHLHSMYDPLKEAKDLICHYEEKLKNNPRAVVLGMGLCYHIKILKKILEKNHGVKGQIIVIDPNEYIFNDYLKSNKIENVSYLITDRINNIYSDKNFINFLVESPIIIKHSASFNLYHDFYKSFLSYKAPIFIHEYLDNIEDKSLKNHIQDTLSDDKKNTFHQYIETLRKSTRNFKKYDYMLIALYEMNKKYCFMKVDK